MAANKEATAKAVYPPKKSGTASVKEGSPVPEKFPILKVPPPGFHKSKSATAAEIMSSMTNDQITFLNQRLKTEKSPLSLEQAKERRASITKQRKESISLIRNRTASKASGAGRPSLKEMVLRRRSESWEVS